MNKIVILLLLGVAGFFSGDLCFNTTTDFVFAGETIPMLGKVGESMKPTNGDSEAKAEERACRDAFIGEAIAFLKGVDECEGVDLPAIPGDLDIPGEGESVLGEGSVVQGLTDLRDAGRICTEARSESENVKAQGSYPQSSANDGDTSYNHPGINVFPGYMAAGDECTKDEETGEYTFDEVKVAEAAVTLAHELYHVMNPAESGASERDEEGPAYIYEGKIIIAILCCDNVSDAVKEKMCELLQEVHDFLAFHDLPLPDMTKCEDEEGLTFTSSPYDLSQLKAINLPYRGTFPQGSIEGRAILNPYNETITLDLHGFQNLEFTIDFGPFSSGLPNFQPTALTFEPSTPGPTSLLVGGYDEQSLEGMIVRVMFDLNSSPPYSSTVVIQSPSFGFPIAIDIPEYAPNRLAILDRSLNTELLGLQLVNGHFELIGDSSSNPGLDLCSFVTAWPDIVVGATDNYAVISTHSETDRERADTRIRFYDIGLDGTFDGSY